MNPNGPVRWGWMNNKAADGLGERSVQIIHSTLRTMRSEAMREELTSTVGTVVEPPNLNRFFDELIAKARVRRTRRSSSRQQPIRGVTNVMTEYI
jgi:hypothetical protein